jgi:hypothetical protein
VDALINKVWFHFFIEFRQKNVESHPNALIFSLDSLDHVFLGRLHTRVAFAFSKRDSSAASQKKIKAFSLLPSRPFPDSLNASSPLNHRRPSRFFATDLRLPLRRQFIVVGCLIAPETRSPIVSSPSSCGRLFANPLMCPPDGSPPPASPGRLLAGKNSDMLLPFDLNRFVA